jgi:hypothetical protein
MVQFADHKLGHRFVTAARSLSDASNFDRVADHIGAALPAFRSGRHSASRWQLDRVNSQGARP